MAGPRYKNSVFGKRVKKKPRVKMTATGRATPNEKTPTVQKNKKGRRQKIVPGFEGLIRERQKIIN